MILDRLENELFWKKINSNYRISEQEAVQNLLKDLTLSPELIEKIKARALALITNLRKIPPKTLSVENFLQAHQLNSQEGLAFMCLAESLLRIPDSDTQNQFIRDKVNLANWSKSDASSFVKKITSFGMSTTSHFLNMGLESKGLLSSIGALTRKFSEPVIRTTMTQFIKVMGQQFVMGETIKAALSHSTDKYRYSYDMLGEGARTQADADRYFNTYKDGLIAIGKAAASGRSVFEMPSLSVKLSAIHPRYEVAQRERVLKELPPLVLELAVLAKQAGIGLTIDAEESERLALSLEIIETVFASPDLKDWDGFGLAIQAYQKRAPFVIEWVADLAKTHSKRICVRLVKGAYWDSEIKRSQEKGLDEYPVYTRKVYTDTSYLLCAEKMLNLTQWIYPQFATHNAYSLSAIIEIAHSLNYQDYEFQRLHGMGESLYDQVLEQQNIPCRVYAPVGEYKDLLSYLVRRLLENGANSSFVNQIYDKKRPAESLIIDPIAEAQKLKGTAHENIPLPRDILQPERQNSKGIDFSDYEVLKNLQQQLEQIPAKNAPEIISETKIKDAIENASIAHPSWAATPASKRAEIIDRLGNLLQDNTTDLLSILIKEGKKTLIDAHAEVREAIDFCKYYALQAQNLQTNPVQLPGPTGELNQLTYHGRGVFVCISPWNFPLAIFLGQITAALVTGNCVLAKPAGQTVRVAEMAINLAHQAGIPRDVLHLIHAPGGLVAEKVLTHPKISGVAFTGSIETAKNINLILAQKSGPIIPFIAETGGINAMIVDSSALPEQVVNDIMISSFQSAGQRCSALRLLFVQKDIAEPLITMITGSMAELKVGDPNLLETDVGPVIDSTAKEQLQKHILYLKKLSTDGKAKLLFHSPLPDIDGDFIAPQIWHLEASADLKSEVFGPILHLVTFEKDQLDHVIDTINNAGYGLTLGLHTRLESTVNKVRQRAHVGNLYINRSMIGAVVGVQPFGGEGLSGTGPKAGGPNYLLKFVTERVFTQDTTAAGGNATLLSEI